VSDEHADHHAIEALLDLYATIIDARDWPLLEDIFLTDAVLDYSESGGTPGPFHEVAAWIEKGLSLFARSQHFISNKMINVDGNVATSRALFFNPLVTPEGQVLFVAGAYIDRWLRTPAGWRIIERVQEVHWTQGLPRLEAGG
jgi:hypothetical protein